MTKWFDMNYHYLVPELTADQTFRLAATKPFDELSEAMAAGITAKPALVGPITYLLLSRSSDGAPLSLLERLLPVYAETIPRSPIWERPGFSSMKPRCGGPNSGRAAAWNAPTR